MLDGVTNYLYAQIYCIRNKTLNKENDEQYSIKNVESRTNQMTSTAASKSNMVSKVAVHVSTIKDESMLPKKYIRKPIDQIEMQIVELGGAHIS
ncbi:hypothetical protein BLOT_008340 [Blomia tropicalis]|nr:hypothetical protein BLOT_008340 [Blomia tropicalis]